VTVLRKARKAELFGQPRAVLLEPARGVLLLTQREQPAPFRTLDSADRPLCGLDSFLDDNLDDVISLC
jgi:hypothetical protein